MALHDANASSSFEQPPAQLLVRALAVHTDQREQTSQHSRSSRHLKRPSFGAPALHGRCSSGSCISPDFATFLLCGFLRQTALAVGCGLSFLLLATLPAFGFSLIPAVGAAFSDCCWRCLQFGFPVRACGSHAREAHQRSFTQETLTTLLFTRPCVRASLFCELSARSTHRACVL